MLRLFTGYDERESIGWHVFAHGALARCSEPLAITALTGRQRDGSNAFTYSRFTVPHLCGFEGWAIFMDGADMVCMADLWELWEMRDERFAVQVVKHEYKTRHPVKYVGTPMRSANVDYERKNWSSVCLWNCAHPSNAILKPALVDESPGIWLQQFSWLRDEEIGRLPAEWNWLTDEYGESSLAKVHHWTAGIPAFREYRNAPHASLWFDEMRAAAKGWQLSEMAEA